MKDKLEEFIKQNRKICWESEYQNGEYCIGENKVRQFFDSSQLEPPVKSEIVDIEFRPNKEDIDEIVAHNAFIHLEYMDQWDIWMSVETEKEKYHIHIQPRNKRSNASLLTFAEKIN